MRQERGGRARERERGWIETEKGVVVGVGKISDNMLHKYRMHTANGVAPPHEYNHLYKHFTLCLQRMLAQLLQIL